MIYIILLVIAIDLSLVVFVVKKEKDMGTLAFLNGVEVILLIVILKLLHYYFVVKLGKTDWETPIFIFVVLYALLTALIGGKHKRWLKKPLS